MLQKAIVLQSQFYTHPHTGTVHSYLAKNGILEKVSAFRIWLSIRIQLVTGRKKV